MALTLSAHADAPPIVTQFSNSPPSYLPLNVNLMNWMPLGISPTNSLDGVTFTTDQTLTGQPIGLEVPGVMNITFSLGLGASEIRMTDLDYGGGNLTIFYQSGNKPEKELTITQGNWMNAFFTGAFTETLIQFKDAVNRITIEGGTSISGLRTVSVPALPEPSNIWTMSLLGIVLLGAVLTHWKKVTRSYK